MLILVAKLIGCVVSEFFDILLTQNISSVGVIVAEFIDCPWIVDVLVAKLIGHIAPELANNFGLSILILPALLARSCSSAFDVTVNLYVIPM